MIVNDRWGTRGRTGEDRQAAPDADSDGALFIFLEGPIERSEIPDLCARFAEMVGERPGGRVICDVAGLTESDAVAVEALARLQLTARRLGCRLWLRHAGRGLRQLIELVGLADVVPTLPAGAPTQRCEDGSGIEAGRQSEQREPPVGVEEVVQPDDPAP
ncbi:STAS domain-containing protein [Actinopolymorpha rutila]|uniref:ABC-type transporter Mla MlaB component n=1 Tax=Actinopolymorpha rutila TaxID=446787 RepID=A0A852Z846_9ACTN|nr:ABC-type transporter Mla MlaB component [Actinopolymorpha rutila]